MVKLDIKTGEIKWQTKMLPDNDGKVGFYSGAAIWGSSPSIDSKRNMVYIATGNLYSAPPNVSACEEIQNNKTVRDVPDPCISVNDHSESVVALDLESGTIVWAHHLGGFDTWTVACLSNGPSSPNCPPVVGPDFDFGEAPMMLSVRTASHSSRGADDDCEWLDIVAVVQKSGIDWALRRDNGTLVWDAVSAPTSSSPVNVNTNVSF